MLEAGDAAVESSGNFLGALGQAVLTLVVFFTWKNAPHHHSCQMFWLCP